MKQVEKNHQFSLFLLILAGALLCFGYYYLNTSRYLAFSDGAKFADIARNLIEGKGYGINFTFFTKPGSSVIESAIFSAKWVPPLMPLAIFLSYLLLGVNDIAVIFTSGVFYLGLVLLTYLIGRKLFSKKVGLLAGLAVAGNINLLDYATSGASETLFIFLILLPIYLFSLRKRITKYFGFVALVILFFARPHAPIYIFGIWAFYLLLRSNNAKEFIKSFSLSMLAVLIIELILRQYSGQFFLQSITKRGVIATYDYSLLSKGNAAIRGGLDWGEVAPLANLKIIATKTFYNLYNFYRLLPQIASPYMWGLFVIGLFHWSKNKAENSLKAATIFMILATFFAVALTIPFFRYLHPVVPLVYLFAVSTLVFLIAKVISDSWSVYRKIKINLGFRVFNLEFDKNKVVAIVSFIIIFVFVVGQTLGVIFLDSRFEAKRTNRGKPPVYVVLSKILKENTNPEDIVVTNLDTWGSWYGERKTVWFPLKPEQLNLGDNKVHFDAIYLTSYLMDDENYYMGPEWRDVFYNPESPEDKYIAENFELKDVYKIASDENYERQEARAVLLVRK